MTDKRTARGEDAGKSSSAPGIECFHCGKAFDVMTLMPVCPYCVETTCSRHCPCNYYEEQHED